MLRSITQTVKQTNIHFQTILYRCLTCDICNIKQILFEKAFKISCNIYFSVWIDMNVKMFASKISMNQQFFSDINWYFYLSKFRPLNSFSQICFQQLQSIYTPATIRYGFLIKFKFNSKTLRTSKSIHKQRRYCRNN